MAIDPLTFATPQAYSAVDFSPLAQLGQALQQKQQLADLGNIYGTAQGQGSPPGAPPASDTGPSAPIGTGNANFMHGQYGKPGENLTEVTLDSGKKVTVNAAAAPSFKAFLNELEGSGYKISDLGGYNNRTIAGTNIPSQHAYGNAIDINPAANPMGARVVTNLPSDVGEMAARHGLVWGGNWKHRKDPMHFEWMGPQ